MMESSFRRRKSLWSALGTLAILVLLAGVAGAQTFGPGDIFVSMKDGTVQWRGPDGTLKGTLTGSNGGHAEGMALDANNNLFVTHWYTSDLLGGNNVDKFDNTGTLIGSFGSGFNCNPRSLVFDNAGNAYVGQSDCGRAIMKFNSSGALVGTYSANVENRGTDWLEMSADGCTLLYTSAGQDILRYNTCTSKQLPNFNNGKLPDTDVGAQALRLLPDGGVLVADFSAIIRLDSGGHTTQTFTFPGFPACWLGLDLDPDGTSFWSTNFCSGDVIKADMGSGLVLLSFNAATATALPKAIKVTPMPPGACGFMTGGGSIFTTDGTRVTHGFELHCDATQPPNNLEVNWLGNRFHMENMTSATCFMDPSFSPTPPQANFNTLIGSGTGRYDGVEGATVDFKLTDAGEPGVNDTATITIKDASGNVVLTVSNKLTFGNQQAHNRKCK